MTISLNDSEDFEMEAVNHPNDVYLWIKETFICWNCEDSVNIWYKGRLFVSGRQSKADDVVIDFNNWLTTLD